MIGKGGYTLVDCTGLDLSNVGKVAGIYNKMLTAYLANKLVICKNIKNGSAQFTPISAFLATETVDSATVIILTIMNIPYRITSDDTVVQA